MAAFATKPIPSTPSAEGAKIAELAPNIAAPPYVFVKHQTSSEVHSLLLVDLSTPTEIK